MKLVGQTSIEPCAICGELAEDEVVLEAWRQDSKGNQFLTRERPLCGKHVAAAKRDAEAAKARTAREAARTKRFKRIQEVDALFDGNAGAPAGVREGA